MPRPRRKRRVRFQPGVTYFKPAGIGVSELEESVMTFDEFEAVRLKDLEGLDQIEAAKKMGISQPTFHRLILDARKKLADAIVNSKAIRIEGGVVEMVRKGVGRRGKGLGFGRPAMTCVCTKCGHKEPKTKGMRCIDRKCPKCGSQMMRGD